jgi:L-aminopeptidase/D-esterase-like protein
MARAGSSTSNGSGDYAIAFSTAPQLRVRTSDKSLTRHVEVLAVEALPIDKTMEILGEHRFMKQWSVALLSRSVAVIVK